MNQPQPRSLAGVVPWIGGGLALALGSALAGRARAAELLEFAWSRPWLSFLCGGGAAIVLGLAAYAAGHLLCRRDDRGGGEDFQHRLRRLGWGTASAVLTAWVALILSVLLRPAWHDLPEDPWLWLKTYGLVLPPVAGWCVAVGALMPHILQGAPGVRVRTVKESCIQAGLFASAALSILTTLGIILVLAGESFAFFREIPPLDFFFGTRWVPQVEPRSFGILPLVCGTFLVAGGGLLIAIPVGLGAAVFLSEYAPPWLRAILKPVLEVLAGVPTVVYGFFALAFVTPYVLKPLFPSIHQTNGLSAIVVVGIMIIPTISSLCDDALRAVPRSLREAAFALSATRMEVSLRIVLPGAMSGVVAAVLLAFARAIGETMAVALAAGMTPTLTMNPLVSIQTMTGYIVQASSGDTPAGSLEFRTIFAVGLTLFGITMVINLLATRVLKRFREAYE